MGYGYYVLADGREAGYDVNAICDEQDCATSIDRGLAYLCGESPGSDEYGCGGYFCGAHLFFNLNLPEGTPQLCTRCIAKALKRVGSVTA